MRCAVMILHAWLLKKETTGYPEAAQDAGIAIKASSACLGSV